MGQDERFQMSQEDIDIACVMANRLKDALKPVHDEMQRRYPDKFPSFVLGSLVVSLWLADGGRGKTEVELLEIAEVAIRFYRCVQLVPLAGLQ